MPQGKNLSMQRRPSLKGLDVNSRPRWQTVRFYPKGLCRCHMNCANSCKKANKKRKEKENLNNPICSELADFPRFSSTPAIYD